MIALPRPPAYWGAEPIFGLPAGEVAEGDGQVPPSGSSANASASSGRTSRVMPVVPRAGPGALDRGGGRLRRGLGGRVGDAAASVADRLERQGRGLVGRFERDRKAAPDLAPELFLSLRFTTDGDHRSGMATSIPGIVTSVPEPQPKVVHLRAGIGGHLRSESVVTFDWNRWSPCPGIRSPGSFQRTDHRQRRSPRPVGEGRRFVEGNDGGGDVPMSPWGAR
jgi:hypothetical protein